MYSDHTFARSVYLCNLAAISSGGIIVFLCDEKKDKMNLITGSESDNILSLITASLLLLTQRHFSNNDCQGNFSIVENEKLTLNSACCIEGNQTTGTLPHSPHSNYPTRN